MTKQIIKLFFQIFNFS